MKRVFSRKRKDYKLFVAALAFGFTATLATLYIQQQLSASDLAAPVIQQASSKQTDTITFAYASPAANNVQSVVKTIPVPQAAAAPAPVLAAVAPQLQPVQQPVVRQHYIKPAASSTEVVAIDKGDTLDQVFETFGVPKDLSVEAVNSLKGIFSPRQFKIGQQITLLFKPEQDGSRSFRGYRFAADPLRDVIVLDDAGKGIFDATIVTKELKNVVSAKQGMITGSLVGAANRAGVPYSVVSEMIRVFSYSIDFQRDIHEGDRFEVMYDSKADKDGHILGVGNMLYARLILDDKEYPIYRYEDSNGNVDYLKADGTSNRRGLIRTPIDGARMSSGFGMRNHPVLGYTKMHKGVDFAAPAGTPIFASGDATVKKAGWANGYGNFVLLSHNASLSTGYGHMSRIAKGLRPGVRVKQGQVIGYVGRTGRATGNHLHYEVSINNVQVNPVGVKVPTANQLAGAEMRRFKRDIDNRQASFKQALAASRNQTASR
ncbi:MAG: peptidase [Alphaproteobacteria bacterium]|nr:peptidase [Alphaproteobacteria bacterium]